jgi:hypothetical protein
MSAATTVATPLEVQFQRLHTFPFQDVQFSKPLQYLSKLSPAVPELQPVQFHELHKELLKELQLQPPEQKWSVSSVANELQEVQLQSEQLFPL